MTRICLLFAVILIIFSLSTLTHGQNSPDEEEQSRGTFLSTRPSKESNNSSAPTKAMTRPVDRVRPSTNKRPTTKPTNQNEGEKAETVPDTNAAKIGLGYTLFTIDKQGKVSRVEPSHQFSSGDSVRIALEPNTDGYLYIFHTENDGKPEMIFPDPRLHRGNNAITAHVPYEVPSSQDPNPSLRWFVFDEHAATERLYVVLSRQPLANVPTSENLVNYCATHKDGCPWHPNDAVWTHVKTINDKPIISYAKTEGQQQTDTEINAANRGIGLAKDAPPPSVIYMSRSTDLDLLVTPINLIHK